MGIRETLNEKPAIAYGGFGVLLLIAIGVLVWYLKSGQTGPSIDKPIGDQAFYSDDDGQHWFLDSVQKATPFKHDGKDAVRAMVYRCSDGKAFVNYLVRHTDAGRQLKGMNLEIGSRPSFSDNAFTEVKKPSGKAWLPVTTKNMGLVNAVMDLSCPNNPNDVPQLLLPGQE